MTEPRRSRREWDAEDQKLIREIAQGDTDAFRRLFQRYYTRVYSFVLRRLGESTSAEDTTVETFAELWRTAKRFRGESRPSTWIYGIAHFKAGFGGRPVGYCGTFDLVTMPLARSALQVARRGLVRLARRRQGLDRPAATAPTGVGASAAAGTTSRGAPADGPGDEDDGG